MAKARIEILGDSQSYQRAIKEAAVVTDKLGVDMKKLGVSAQSSADAQIKASLRKDARLRQEIAAYKRVASAAAHGSKEQVVAANLAAQAEARLGRSLGVTAHEQVALSKSASKAERDLGHATRGALAGSGVFRSLGRSIAFASGGFLAFATAGQFLRSSIDAAREAQVSEKQLAAQLKASGKSYADYRGEINKTNLRLGALAGFQNEELNASFTTIFRASRNVQKTLRDEALAANIARARHISLAAASVIVGKVEAGNVGILRRAGVQIAKNATVEQALAVARARFAGQAKAGTTDQERFGAVLHDTEEIIGAGLLPTLDRYLVSSTKWLSQSKNQATIQRDVASATHGVEEAAHAVSSVFNGLNKITGSTGNTVKALGTAFLILETRAKLIKWGLITTGIESVGAASAASAGEVNVLSARLAGLRKLGPIIIPLALSFVPPDKKGQAALDKAGIGFLGHLPIVGHAEQQVAQAGQRTHDFLFGKPKTPQQKGLNPATRGFVQSTPSNVSGELKVGDPTTAARTLLNQTFAQAKLLNPELTRKAFDLGQKVARAYILGLNKKPSEKPKLPVAAKDLVAPKALSLAGRFNLAELRLANAQLTKTSADDKAILQTEAAIVRQQIAGAKKLKDRTALTQQLVGIMGQLAALSKKASDNFTLPERFSLAAAKASATATQKDDLAAARETKVFVSKLIASGKLRGQALEQAYGDLASANDQLLSAQKDAAQKTLEAMQKRLARRTGRQFAALGLDPTGAALTPNTKSLKKDLGKFSAAVSGTFLDTSKTQSVLSKIRRVLKGGLGAVSKDVRSTIKGMLDDLDQQLKDHSAPQTRFAAVSTNKVLAGLGLSPDQIRGLRGRLSQIGPGGTVPIGSAGASGPVKVTTVIHTHFMLDGREVAVNTTKHQQKAGRRNPHQKRGAFAGGGL